jgi:hypothetical protein
VTVALETSEDLFDADDEILAASRFELPRADKVVEVENFLV